MTDQEVSMMHIGHCLGLLHAYYLLEVSSPDAAQKIAEIYGSYCRQWGSYNHITGEVNSSGAS